MAKVPVFISFDYDHDNDLKVMLAGQAKHDDSPFEIVDHSIKEESADWKDKARTRIKRSQQVIVICGNYTDTAVGVTSRSRSPTRRRSRTFSLVAVRRVPTRGRPQRSVLTKSTTGSGQPQEAHRWWALTDGFIVL